MSRPLASLSLDLDNKWSYLKTHGDPGWEALPTYLDVVVPRVLEVLEDLGLRITFFIVGQDAARPESAQPLAAIAAAGHEIGNHSFHHEPWLHRYSPDTIRQELRSAHEQIERVTGLTPRGFRGPGFSCTPEVLATLVECNYAYDASTFPTFIGPLARMYYFWTAHLTRREREERRQLFGNLSEGFRPLKAHRVETTRGSIVEIPVTTMPWTRAPFHLSYLLYLETKSRRAALAYYKLATTLCRLRGVAPSLLLHPLDFLGVEDQVGLDYFPAMRISRDRKLDLVRSVLEHYTATFDVKTLLEHANAVGRVK